MTVENNYQNKLDKLTPGRPVHAQPQVPHKGLPANLIPKDNYTCPQCDRTFPGILEFTHECTYNYTETNA